MANDMDCEGFVKQGIKKLSKPHWTAVLPSTGKSVYVRFKFRDGTMSDEIRYPVSEIDGK